MAKKKTDPNPPVVSELLEQTEDQTVTDSPVQAESENLVQEPIDAPADNILQTLPDEADAEISDNETGTKNDVGEDETLLPDMTTNGEPENGDPKPPLSDSETEESEFGELLQELGVGETVPVEPVAYEQEELSADDLLLLSGGEAAVSDEPEPTKDAHNQNPRPLSPAYIAQRNRVLTIDARDEIQTEEEREATIWHEIQNAYRTRRILTGTLDVIERTPSGFLVVVIIYKGFRVLIPLKEMMIDIGRMPDGSRYADTLEQINRIINSRVFSEIDFVIKGIENKTRKIAASRKEAMFRKRKTFYMDPNEFGEPMIYEGRVVQARVVAVTEKVVRVEVFGVEAAIRARDLSWEWIGDAKDYYAVGDRILVRILKINRPSVEDITITADVRSVSSTTNYDNLKKCLPQSRHAARVTDVRNGVIYLRLNIGANAIAHSCYDRRTPGKNDDVSFAVTRIDEEQGVAVGIITRIIKQNL